MEETSFFLNFKKSWDNWWYHYKFQTWVVIFVVFCGILTIYYGTLSKAPDLFVTYIGNSASSDILETTIAEMFKGEIVDLNSDNKKTVEVRGIYVKDDNDLKGNLFNLQQLDIDIASATSDLFILDKFTYEVLKERNYFEPINGDYFIDISNNSLFSSNSDTFSDKYLCVRIKTEFATKQKEYKNRQETIENILQKTLAK